MRLLAFTLLGLAAFDWPIPPLDRVGTAVLGLAVWALVNPIGRSRVRGPAMMNLPPKRVAVPDPVEERVVDLADRLAGYEARTEASS